MINFFMASQKIFWSDSIEDFVKRNFLYTLVLEIRK